MGVSLTYGGWVASRSAGTSYSASSHSGFQPGAAVSASTATNDSSGIVRWLGYFAAAGVALTGIGTGGELSIEHLQRSSHQMQYMMPVIEMAEVAHERTPVEDLARIREVLKPAVSDLAITFGVSRQSVYNWLNGESVAQENVAKLQDLAHAADVLAREGLTSNAALLKRKFANGRTLMQVAQAGESARDAALQLVHIHNREKAQRERMAARFANRPNATPSADFDLPLANHNA